MKKRSLTVISILLYAVCILVTAGDVFCDEYTSLKDLKSIKAVFDMRIGDAQSIAVHLKLIHDTYKDKSITAISDEP